MFERNMFYFYACVYFFLALENINGRVLRSFSQYKRTYPITPVVAHNGKLTYKIAIIADMDERSKHGDEFMSFLKKGTLTVDSKFTALSVKMNDDDIKLTSNFGVSGRGMELSDLVTFNAKLYSCDDRTGVIYEVRNDTVVQFVQLQNDRDKKGFKCEWLAVKNDLMYAGSTGKEWIDDGIIKNKDSQLIKTIDTNKVIKSFNWTEQYNALRAKTGYSFPGYLIHESAVWSEWHRKWFFLPRKASKEIFDKTKDEISGANLMITADENFKNVEFTTIGNLDGQLGFSAFRFIPGSKDTCFVALKTREVGNEIETFFLAFNLEGKLLITEPINLGKKKYEGIEFI